MNQAATLDGRNGRAKWLAIVLMGLLAIGIVLWLAPRRPITDPDAFDYLQIGIRIAAGEGFVSGRAVPEYLVWYRDHKYETLGRENVPLLERYLLPVLIEAGLIRAGIPPYSAAQVYSAMGYILSNLLLLILFRRMTQSTWAAFVLVLGFMLAENALGASVSGMTEPFALALFAANLLVLLSPFPRRYLPVALGVMTAVAYLNRTSGLFYTLPLNLAGLWFATADAKRKERLVAYGIFLLTAFLIPSPWFVRNLMVAGAPVFSFADRYNFLIQINLPNPPNERNYYAAEFTQYIPFIVAKFFRNLWTGIAQWRSLLLVNVLLVIPFLLGLACLALYALKSKNARLTEFFQRADAKGWVDWKRVARLYVLLGVAVAGNGLGISFYVQEGRLYAPFHPFVLLLAWCGISALVAILPLQGRAWLPTAVQVAIAVVVGVSYVALNLPHATTALTPAAIDTPTVLAYREARRVYCQPSVPGAILSDLTGMLAVESFGCHKLTVGFARNSDIALIRELARPSSVLLSNKIVDTLPADNGILAFALTCAKVETLADGSRLYSGCPTE